MSEKRKYLLLFVFKHLPTIKLRCWYLRKLGATIGTNTRIHEVEFMNIDSDFSNLRIGANCYIGPSVMFDLSERVRIDDGAVISLRTTILTHNNPGSAHNSPICQHFPPERIETHIGSHVWIGAGTIILAGTIIENEVVLAAGSVARGRLLRHGLYAGQPAKLKRMLTVTAT